jgi:hypothetical protein
MGGSSFIASANQRPTAQFHENLACRRSTSPFRCGCGPLLASQAAVLHRPGPVHRVTKRPHQSAQLARAARFASERSVFPALFCRVGFAPALLAADCPLATIQPWCAGARPSPSPFTLALIRPSTRAGSPRRSCSAPTPPRLGIFLGCP